MMMLIVIEGVSLIDDTSLFGGGDNKDPTRNTAIDNTIKQIFNTIKTCKYGDEACAISGYKDLNKKHVMESWELSLSRTIISIQ